MRPSDMGKRSIETPWDKMAQDEADALAQMLESEDRKVMVIIIAAQTDQVGTTMLLHGCSSGTKGSHLRQFISGVERQLQYLGDKLHRRI